LALEEVGDKAVRAWHLQLWIIKFLKSRFQRHTAAMNGGR
jgi:hypothetical protein